MQYLARSALACLLSISLVASAGEPDSRAAHSSRLSADMAAVIHAGDTRDHSGRPHGAAPRRSSFARALDEAWRKDAAEANLKAWTEVLVRCQQATNPAWTTALMRSEPQQAHCYRY
jgi:hypothetical protein